MNGRTIGLKCVAAVAAAVCLMTTGCASIIKGGNQNISIATTPSEAKVTIYGKQNEVYMNQQSTPCVASLKRGNGYFSKAQYRLVFEKDGYQKSEVLITGQINGWYLGGNLIFGGLIGYLIVDPLTGGMWTLAPEHVTHDLQQKQAGVVKCEKGSLVVMLKEQVPVELRQQLTRVQ